VSDYVRRVPDNVVNLKPANTDTTDPAQELLLQILDKLNAIETRIDDKDSRLIISRLEDRMMAIEARLEVIEVKIGATEKVVGMVYENVKPTLDMLTNGPIGQLLGIAPPPAPRERIGRRSR
jgi:hypothetical protein